MPTIIDQIDDRYIDVDFERDPRYVFGDLGVGLCGATYGVFEEQFAVMSDAEIDAAIEAIDGTPGSGLEYLVSRVYDQRSEGSCVANACGQAHEICQAMQFGKDRVIPLSAMSLYKRIGRSPGSGAMVSDGLAEGQSRGFLPLDTPENRARFGAHVMPNTGWSTPFPSGWETTGKQIVFLEADIIRSMQGLKTFLAQQLGGVVVGRQGHSICYTRLARKSGRRVAPYPNSWSLNWGSPFGELSGGFGFDSESQIAMSAQWAFGVRAVSVPVSA